MQRFLFFLAFIFHSFLVSAQFNDSTNYYIRQHANGMINRTNDRNAYVLNNGLRFSLYRKSISLNSTNTWIYGKQQGQLSNNDFASILDFDVYKTKRSIYYWGLLNYEKSFSLKIDHRFQGGLGVGFYIINSDRYVIQLSDGILYERSILMTQENIANSDYDTYRNSFRVKFRFVFADRITFDHVTFFQHSLEDRKDYITRSNSNILIKLYKAISLSVVANYNKISVTGRENFLLNYGLTFERYF